MAAWPADRNLMFCDETRAGVSDNLKRGPKCHWAIFIGPEGGFSETERVTLNSLPQTNPVSLGPRILRADTAVVAAMTVWQLAAGDW
jgi:16S rRNA (uracil1498-N3)-methyltransferase